jgi:DinB superfamily
MNGVMAAPANPEIRANIKVTDAQLMAGVESRANKVKTSEPFEPKNAKWNTMNEALDYLKEKRGEHAKIMKSTDMDMRNHIAAQGPAGPMDAYQIIILLAQHTKRHQAQIEEVKTESGYPM